MRHTAPIGPLILLCCSMAATAEAAEPGGEGPRPRRSQRDLRHLDRLRLPAHEIAEQVGRGQWETARHQLEKQIETNGLAQRQRRQQVVELVDDLGSRGTYRSGGKALGLIRLKSEVADKGRAFAKDFSADPAGLSRTMARFDFEIDPRPDPRFHEERDRALDHLFEADGFRTLLHEVLHGYGPRRRKSAKSSKGTGASRVVEEVSTEMLARQLLRRWFAVPEHEDGDVRIGGSYSRFTLPLLHEVETAYGVDRSRAERYVEQASQRYKARDVELRSEKGAVELFVEQFPRKPDGTLPRTALQRGIEAAAATEHEQSSSKRSGGSLLSRLGL